MQKKYPHIKRVYVRAEFPHISEDYRSSLLRRYEHTYFPQRIIHSGKAAYVERNQEMIDKSSFCIFYYDENYTPQIKGSRRYVTKKKTQSGTKLAYAYAKKKNVKIKNLFITPSTS